MRSISLRSQLKGEIDDFLDNENMSCTITQDGMVNLINAIALYKEEGKSLFPEIFIVDDFDKLKNELKPFSHHIIGEGEKSAHTMLTALKKCAPLTEGGGWSIYILRKVDKFEYGVFRYGEHILSVNAKKILMDTSDKDAHIIHIHQLTDKTVELSGVNSESMIINFGINTVGDQLFIKDKTELINSILKNVKEPNIDPADNFLSRILNGVLQKSHGTLVAVIDSKKELPKFLRDGIILDKKISMENYVEELLSTQNLSASYSIEGCSLLISGMLLSDGITIFDINGNIRAYNVFVKLSEKKNKRLSGGARERTFEYLCNRINKGIVAAFFQSQDGKTKFKGK